MLYIIPAWYQQDQWYEKEQKWYETRMQSEFDDSVELIRLFHRSGKDPYQILLLSCAPNFRHFLHRQGIYHAAYWSCFDAIQEIRAKQARPFSFHDLSWPSGTEFEYTPFAVTALLHGKKYAQAEFGEDGNLIQVDFFREDMRIRQNNYDDRGFLSNMIVYEKGIPVYQDFLNEKGRWKLRCFLSDGHAEVNSADPHYLLLHQGTEHRKCFQKRSYESMGQVIAEVLKEYLRLSDGQDMVCAAMHEQHMGLLMDTLKNRKKIWSFYGNRFDIKTHREALGVIAKTDYIVADSPESVSHIRKAAGIRPDRITAVSPFDTGMDLGISQQLKVQKILAPVDGMSNERFGQLISYLGFYLLQNRNAQVHLFTRQAAYERKSQLMRQTISCLRQAGLEEKWAAEQMPEEHETNRLKGGASVRFFPEQCVEEFSVWKCMREQRILVDMRENVPDRYLSILAVGFGIPQIVYGEPKLVETGKNGLVLQDMSDLPDALQEYLERLNNWNKAMIHSCELKKKYTPEALLETWREVIRSVGEDSDPAAGNC